MQGGLLKKWDCSRLESSLSSFLPQQDTQSRNAGPPSQGSLSQAWLLFWEVPASTEAGQEGMVMGHMWSSVTSAVAT